MSYIEIHPKNKETEKILVAKRDALFEALTKCVKDAYGVPDYDIICELDACRVIAFSDQNNKMGTAPDAIIKVSTNDIEFKERAELLKDFIIEGWTNLFGENLAMECWVVFFHTWGCNMELG